MLTHHIPYGSEEAVEVLPQPFSICKVTALLSDSDSLSMYDTDQPVHHHYEYPTTFDHKLVKPEPITSLLFTESNYCSWQSKFIDLWDSQDCLYWYIHEIQDIKKDQLPTEFRIEAMADMDGVALKHMSREAFVQRFPDVGTMLYERLQKVKSPFMHNSYCGMDWNGPILQGDEPFVRYSHTHSDSLTRMDQEPDNDNDNDTRFGYNSLSDVESGYKTESEGDGQGSAGEGDITPEPPRPEKRRPGRPRGTRKKKPEKLGRLWEFIRDLLLNPQYNPSFICWEDYEKGMFRFVHSDRVAKLWGSKKQNGDMNYEKLSRAMRYYYKSQVLLPVYNKRLVYKFGPNATGWRSDRPIFR